jgi:RND family efflux transporter MFP subunit
LKKAWVWTVVLIVSIVGLIGYNVFRLNQRTPVELAALESGMITESVFASGTIEAVNMFNHFAPMSGTIETLKVKQGDPIKQGELLYSFDMSEVEKSLMLERNNLRLIEQERNSRREQWLETVKKQRLESGSFPAELETPPELSTYDVRIENQRLQIAALEEKLQLKEVTAKGDGIVTEVSIKEGALATQGAAGVVVTDMTKFRVRGKLNEFDAGRVELDLKAQVSGDAFTDIIEGRVNRISPVTVPSETSREPLIEVFVELEGDARKLRPGYSASIEIKLPGEEHLLAPLTSIHREGDNTYVFKVAEEKAVKVQVKTGLDDGERIQIIEGLQAEDQIVRDVQKGNGLREGLKVKLP